jgi:hypothetical protein
MLPGKFEFEVKKEGYTRWWSEQSLIAWNRRTDATRPQSKWLRNFDPGTSAQRNRRVGPSTSPCTQQGPVNVKGVPPWLVALRWRITGIRLANIAEDDDNTIWLGVAPPLWGDFDVINNPAAVSGSDRWKLHFNKWRASLPHPFVKGEAYAPLL